MLKLKNGVDLQELLNYGFEYSWNEFRKCYCYNWKNYYNVICLEVIIDTRIIYNGGDKIANDVLYDLIQAGLVEKV